MYKGRFWSVDRKYFINHCLQLKLHGLFATVQIKITILVKFVINVHGCNSRAIRNVSINRLRVVTI